MVSLGQRAESGWGFAKSPLDSLSKIPGQGLRRNSGVHIKLGLGGPISRWIPLSLLISGEGTLGAARPEPFVEGFQAYDCSIKRPEEVIPPDQTPN
jgi:hypothetical protein